MARLIVHVEGQTEETFVNEVLQGFLIERGYYDVFPQLVGNPRLQQRGGIKPWPSVKKEIVRHLRHAPDLIATTMVDYYALPQEGAGAWPGREAAIHLRAPERGPYLGKALLDDVIQEMGGGFDARRFVPFVVMHEFEGLLFSDCTGFSRGIGMPELEPEFRKIRGQFLNPEEINDSPVTAPSKRVQKIVPRYEKPLFGVLAALEIGLAAIRRECPHFNNWLTQLEDRAAQ